MDQRDAVRKIGIGNMLQVYGIPCLTRPDILVSFQMFRFRPFVELDQRRHHLTDDNRQVVCTLLGARLIGIVGVSVDALPSAVQLNPIGRQPPRIESRWLIPVRSRLPYHVGYNASIRDVSNSPE